MASVQYWPSTVAAGLLCCMSLRALWYSKADLPNPGVATLSPTVGWASKSGKFNCAAVALGTVCLTRSRHVTSTSSSHRMNAARSLRRQLEKYIDRTDSSESTIWRGADMRDYSRTWADWPAIMSSTVFLASLSSCEASRRLSIDSCTSASIRPPSATTNAGCKVAPPRWNKACLPPRPSSPAACPILSAKRVAYKSACTTQTL